MIHTQEVSIQRDQVALPDFLIIGAAKSGTTSLYHYLDQHPEVHMSPIKEPKFITSRFFRFPSCGIGDARIQKDVVTSYADYCSLFRTSINSKVSGEASADNLYYYKDAIAHIKNFIGNPKIVIILRNPAERAYSAYLSLVREGREFLSFEKALKQEESRKNNNWEYIWFYRDVGFYYKQVQAYMEHFDNVKVFIYDDLQRDNIGLMKELYRFLEVDVSFKPDTRIRYNISGVPRYIFIHRFLSQPNIVKKILSPFLHLFLSDKTIERTTENLKIKNLAKPRMKNAVHKQLVNTYHKDIMRLQDLLNRDLSNWLI